jgi:hypothetical protein
MSEKPILMSAPMVRAILEGRKTQTRRVAAIHWDTSRHWGDYDCWTFKKGKKPLIGFTTENRGQDTLLGFCPQGAPGDLLWVRETWAPMPGGPATKENGVLYRADGHEANWLWKPSIYMPRWASRITLEIVSVRVERLQDIGEGDAIAEGIELILGDYNRRDFSGCWKDYTSSQPYWNSPKDSYHSLWETINGKGSWALNPYVWVIEFKTL